MCGMLQVFCTSLLPMMSLMWGYASHISILQTTKSWTKIWRVNNTKTIVHESKLCNVPHIQTCTHKFPPLHTFYILQHDMEKCKECRNLLICELVFPGKLEMCQGKHAFSGIYTWWISLNLLSQERLYHLTSLESNTLEGRVLNRQTRVSFAKAIKVARRIFCGSGYQYPAIK